MCSLSAVYNDDNALKDLFFLASSGQNRGDESAGFAVCAGDERIVVKRMKNEGGISSAYKHLAELVGERDVTRGIAQTRYSTRGLSVSQYAQPIRVKKKHEIIIGHNGTVSNSKEFAEEFGIDSAKDSTDTDVIARYLSDADSISSGIKDIVKNCIGSYNLSIIDESNTLTVLRDPLGFHPLWEGFGENGEIYFASEDSALFSLGCYKTRELEPGEMIQISEQGRKTTIFKSEKRAECAFEPFYFMKPGSSHKGRLVQDIRYEIGRVLGENEEKASDGIVVPVLDSGKYYAEGFSDKTGMPLVEAIMKNKGERVYMDPSLRDPQRIKLTRKEKAKLKHVVIPSLVKGKNVYLTDDSIVRSDTSSAITESLKAAGAKNVHWRIAFPKIEFGCIYGLDHSVKKELVTYICKTEEDIARKIGADSVRYLTMKDMKKIFADTDNYCFACITGKYPTPVPKECISAIE